MNRPLGKLRHRWEDIIKLIFKETGCEILDCIHLAQEMVHKPPGCTKNFWLIEQLLVSQEMLCTMDLAIFILYDECFWKDGV
jgi:hypothetical protein